MNIYRTHEYPTRILIHLYDDIDKLDDVVAKHRFDNNKLYLFDHEALSIFIEYKNNNYYLVSPKPYHSLSDFSIQLGSGKSLFNKRVVNEVRVKLNHVVKSVRDAEEIFISNVINTYLTQTLDKCLEKMNKSVFSKLIPFKKESVYFSDIWGGNLTQQGIIGCVDFSKTWGSPYKAEAYVTFNSGSAFEQTYIFLSEGCVNTIKRNFIKTIRAVD